MIGLTVYVAMIISQNFNMFSYVAVWIVANMPYDDVTCSRLIPSLHCAPMNEMCTVVNSIKHSGSYTVPGNFRTASDMLATIM